MNVLESNNNDDNIILSVSESDEISIKDVGTIIAKCFNYEHRIVFDTSFSDGQYKKTVSNEKLLKRFPEFKFIDVEDGIKRTVEWFILTRSI